MHLSSAQNNLNKLIKQYAHSSISLLACNPNKDNHVALSLKKTDEIQWKHMLWLRYFLCFHISLCIYTCIYKQKYFIIS